MVAHRFLHLLLLRLRPFSNNYLIFAKFLYSFLYILKFERVVGGCGDCAGSECGVLINIYLLSFSIVIYLVDYYLCLFYYYYFL